MGYVFLDGNRDNIWSSNYYDKVQANKNVIFVENLIAHYIHYSKFGLAAKTVSVQYAFTLSHS